MPPDQRLAALLAWLRQVLGQPLDGLEPASSDASFRRYFRAWRDGRSFIAMDAPPPREDLRTFLSVAALLRSVGLRTPEVYAADEENGFALLSDFGTRRYLDCLDDQSAGQLYGDALAALMKLQSGLDPAASGLPGYGNGCCGANWKPSGSGSWDAGWAWSLKPGKLGCWIRPGGS